MWFVILVFYLVKTRSVMKLLGKDPRLAALGLQSSPLLAGSNPRTQTLCAALQIPLQIDNIC